MQARSIVEDGANARASYRRLSIRKAAFLRPLAAAARAGIVAPDVAPGIPDRLVRIDEISPALLLVLDFEDVFIVEDVFIFFEYIFAGAAPIQRYEHILDVTEIDGVESLDVVGG